MSKNERSSVWFHELAAPDVIDYAMSLSCRSEQLSSTARTALARAML